jgi:hypothetical protein
VREHDVCLGDTVPSSGGVPIGLGWTVQSECVVSIDEYESKKHRQDGGRDGRHRTRSQLKMPQTVRMKRLMEDGGYSRLELMHAMKQSNMIRVKRHQTMSSIIQRQRQRRRLQQLLTTIRIRTRSLSLVPIS